VGELVARDPALSAKLIHLANSAVFGLQLEVASPKDAVTYLGLETTRALVLMAHSFAFFDQVIPSRFSIEHLQAHSLNTAHIARRIAEAEGQESQQADQAFTAGLLHDIGKLVLAANLPEAFSQALAMAAEQRRSLWETESQIFGASHAEIGAVLLGHWGLPLPVLQAVAGHHCPELGGQFPGFSTVTAVHVADVLEHESGSGNLTTAVLDLSYLQLLDSEGRLECWRQCCRPEPQAA
jgi:putative nucleotidyltransferase with HDIG domain